MIELRLPRSRLPSLLPSCCFPPKTTSPTPFARGSKRRCRLLAIEAIRTESPVATTAAAYRRSFDLSRDLEHLITTIESLRRLPAAW